MDIFTAYSQSIKDFQNSLLGPMKQIQTMQNSLLEIVQPMQSRLSEIQALCNSAYAPLQSLQSAFTANLQFQSQLSSIASIGSQLQNSCINPYIKELKSCGSMLSLGAVNPNFGNAKSAFSSASIAKNLAAQLTIPPVYSVSPLAYDLKTSMVDQETDEVTVQFKDFAKKISELHPEDFAYTEINDDEVEISAAMSKIIDASFPESVKDFRSQEKSRIATVFFRMILIPLLAFSIPLGYQIYSDHQSAIASDKHLAEEQKQTEYLHEISESLKSCECNKHIDSPDGEQEHHYPKE